MTERTEGSGSAGSGGRPPSLPRWTALAICAFVAIAAVALLVLHTVSCTDCVRVNTTSLGLLAILLVLPLAPSITKLRAGDLEAQIGREEIRELRESAADLPPQSTTIHLNVPTPEAKPTDPPSVAELVERDPQLGLAKLRMDLEQELKRLYFSGGREPSRRPLSLTTMARELGNEEMLAPEVLGPLREVSMLANRAVHGEYVPTDAARDIADVGTRVLEALRAVET